MPEWTAAGQAGLPPYSVPLPLPLGGFPTRNRFGENCSRGGEAFIGDAFLMDCVVVLVGVVGTEVLVEGRTMVFRWGDEGI